MEKLNDGFVRDVHVSKLIIDPNNNNVFYATTQGATEYTDKVGDGAGVFKSTDRGNWTQINNGLDSLETNILTVEMILRHSILEQMTTEFTKVQMAEIWKKLTVSSLSKSFGVGDIIVDPQNSTISI